MSEALIEQTIAVFKPYEKLMPSLDPKYLKRPPIKFLALTVGALSKKTGFAAGLFTPDQLKGNLPEREDKLNFFSVLKQYTQILIGEAIDVEPKDIAAGKEVDKTLMFMQAFVHGAENPKVPFDAALAQVKGGAPAAAAPAADDDNAKAEEEKKKREALEKKKREALEKKKREAEEAKKKAAEEAAAAKADEDDAAAKEKEAEEERKKAEALEKKKREALEKKKREAEEAKKKAAEEEKRKKAEEAKKKAEEAKKKAEEERRRKEQEEVEVEDQTVETTTTKTSGKAPPKARDEVSVVVDAVAPDVIREEEVDDDVDDVFVEEDARGTDGISGDDKGQLVQDILKSCKRMGQDQSGKDTGMGDADRFKQGIELSKGLLQHLARSAQPLDTLIQFSQEDLGNMENEYKRWTAECDKQQRALEAEKQMTEQQLTELKSKIEELDKDIVRQESKLRSIKAAAFLKENDLMKQFTTLCG